MIFIDMDGVLCDFIGAACNLHGHDIGAIDWPDGVYEVWNILGITEDEFWQPIHQSGHEWWGNLVKYDWADELISISESRSRVAISTSPSRDGASAYGKTLWIAEHFPRLSRRMMIGPRKEWLAGVGRILIDDSDDKINAWEKAGGVGILFPQPWNSRYNLINDRLEVVNNDIRALMGYNI